MVRRNTCTSRRRSDLELPMCSERRKTDDEELLFVIQEIAPLLHKEISVWLNFYSKGTRAEILYVFFFPLKEL